MDVEILEPREGIGVHCLPKDTRMFPQSSSHFKSKILTKAIEVDQEYRRYIAETSSAKVCYYVNVGKSYFWISLVQP